MQDYVQLAKDFGFTDAALLPVADLVVGTHHIAMLRQKLHEIMVPSDVFTHTMDDLHNALGHHTLRGCDHIGTDDLAAVGRPVLERFKHIASLLGFL